MEHQDYEVCARCNGSGVIPCPHCDDGLVAIDLWSYRDEPFQSIEVCSHCGGSGKQDCPDCNGVGELVDLPE